MLKGDFGISFTQQNRSVNDIIVKHFPVSATLGILAIVFAAIGGIMWGALTALYRNRLPDIVIMFLVILGISVPSFVFAALGQLGLVHLNEIAGRTLLPVAGWGNVSHMIVPSLVLGLGTMAFLTRLMRSSMLEIVNADYIRTAKAKGLPLTRIFLKHELRNAILPVITVLGPAIAAITTGGFVVELVFAIPGLGPLLRAGRTTTRLHRDHGHDGVLRRVPRADGDPRRSAVRRRRSSREARMSMAEAACKSSAFEPVTVERRRAAAHAAVVVVLAGRVDAAASAIAALSCRCTSSSALLAFTIARPVGVARRPREPGRRSGEPAAGGRSNRRPSSRRSSRGSRVTVTRRASRPSAAKPLTVAVRRPANTQAVRLVWTADPLASGIPDLPQHHAARTRARPRTSVGRDRRPIRRASKIASISTRCATTTRSSPSMRTARNWRSRTAAAWT